MTRPPEAASPYSGTGPLAARGALYRWQRDRVDLPGEAVRLLSGVAGPVLDAGCGLGGYTARLRADRPELVVLPVDRSPAMAGAVVADAARLPVADGALGGVLAMHLLYHVPDIPGTLREFRRTLRGDGVALLSTVGAGDKAEIAALWCAALADLTGATPTFPDPAARFRLGDVGMAGAVFGTVRVVTFDRLIVVPEADPVTAYMDSLRALTPLPGDIPWSAFLARVTARVRADLPFTVRTRVGIAICLP